ncbi:TetR/AcrR family transcriptional regulator [Nocardioides sp.]|uniref:TetR/AcrR family transcriptional regulator n=1 Tax=Nocardioides sp. TaxID=35761 RepID=UPI0035681355
MKADTSPAGQGRPRDPRIDAAVLAAAAELVVEVGYAELSIAAIAERAGTSKPAIYRRWPSKTHLLHEAAFPTEDERLTLPDSGSLAEDLAEMLRRTAAAFADPVARAITPGLMAEIAADPALHPALLERFGGAWKGFHDRIVLAAERGEVRADADPDILIETLAGAALMRLLLAGDDPLDEGWVSHTTDLLMKGIAA